LPGSVYAVDTRAAVTPRRLHDDERRVLLLPAGEPEPIGKPASPEMLAGCGHRPDRITRRARRLATGRDHGRGGRLLGCASPAGRHPPRRRDGEHHRDRTYPDAHAHVTPTRPRRFHPIEPQPKEPPRSSAPGRLSAERSFWNDSARNRRYRAVRGACMSLHPCDLRPALIAGNPERRSSQADQGLGLDSQSVDPERTLVVDAGDG